MEVADATGTPTPLGRRCREVWREAESKPGPSSDHTEVIRYLEEILSESLRPCERDSMEHSVQEEKR